MKPFLSIVVAFCDKDYQYIESLIDNINQSIKLNHEIILIDNRENTDVFINFKNAKVYKKGFNSYQFEARRFSIQFCSGKYVWFVDADDKIFNINEDLQQIDADLICFNCVCKNKIIRFPYSIVKLKYLYEKSRINILSSKELCNKYSKKDIWDIFGCTLWNKWIKRDLINSVINLIPENKIIVASEDIFYSSLFITRSNTVAICSDVIYLYNEALANGNEQTMTDNKFFHIIKGRKNSRELFEKLIPDYEKFDDIQYSVAYFYCKLISSQNPQVCFKEMMNHFNNEELEYGLHHEWITSLEEDQIEKLYNLYDVNCRKNLSDL